MAENAGDAAARQRDQQFHARHAAEALQILKTLAGSGRKLAPSVARQCEEYAVEVLKGRHFTPWLLVYAAVSGSFREGWIPDNFYGAKVIPAIQGMPGRLSSQKSLAGFLFKSSVFPDIGALINGSLFNREYRLLSVDGARSLFFEDTDQIVFKSDFSGRGRGIRFLDEQTFNAAALGSVGNGVFQRHVTQHEMLARYSPSVATIRLTTVVEPDRSISARAAYLRLGSGSDTHVQSATHVRVPLDVKTGALGDIALLADWWECDRHPTSGVPFGGREVPAFDRCLSTVQALHQSVPFVQCIGWDVTVDADGEVQVLEWNGFHNDIKFSEATKGPCFTGLDWERFASAG